MLLDGKIIGYTADTLSDIDRSAEVAQWSIDHIEHLSKYLDEYNFLIAAFNEVEDERLLETMPSAKRLKESLDGVPLPTIDEMTTGNLNFARALIRSRDLILKGQEINKGEIEATPEEKLLAIGTPSYKTSPEALAVGTAAHLLERTFFEWAKRNREISKEKWDNDAGWVQKKWKKDDWLHALKDILILLEAKKVGYFELTEIFLGHSNVDGLGWLKDDELESRKKELRTILNS